MGALRTTSPCAFVECALRRYAMHAWECVCMLSVPLMHSCRCCVFLIFFVLHHPRAFGRCQISCCCCGSVRPSCQIRTLRHTKATPTVRDYREESRRTFCCFSPPLPLSRSLSLFGTGRNVWKEEGGIPCSSCVSVSLLLSIWRACWWRGSVLHFHL